MTESGKPLSAATERRLRNFVDGSWVDAKDGRTSQVVDPSTGQAYAEAALSGAEDVDMACRAAASAFERWRDSTPAERSRMLLRLADGLEARAEEFIVAEGRNTGKPLALTRSEELPPLIDQVRFFAGAARILEGRSAGEYLAGHTSWIRREPIGVCAQVTPWNYPLMMAIWKISPALAAGNTVVLKPSDTTPVTTLMLAELAGEIFPPGVFNVITGDRDTGRALIAHPIPQMVSITGSVRAGREVATAARGRSEEGPPRARGQGTGCCLRRCRRRGRRRGHCRCRFLQRRSGLHRRDAGARRAPGP